MEKKYFYELQIKCKKKYASEIDLLIESFFDSVTYNWEVDIDDEKEILLLAYSAQKPNEEKIQSILELFYKEKQIQPLGFVLNKKTNKDWVKENLKEFKPIDILNFYIHGSHISDIPQDKISLQIDASLAFGTGEHQTTKGCLVALDYIKNNVIWNNNISILDLGCGSAILTMASSYLFNNINSLIGVDIDKQAVEVAEYNAKVNKLTNDIDFYVSEGYGNKALKDKKFNIICANILANPLIELAPENVNHMHSGSYIILSGFIKEDEKNVVNSYTKLGLVKERETIFYDEWCTVILRKD